MFQEMRRFKQKLDVTECNQILKKNTSGVLALALKDDYPYAVPLSFVYDENHIFFHSAKIGHKIDILKKNPKASFCVIDKDEIVSEKFTTYYRSVIVFGHLSIIEDEQLKRKAISILAKKYAPFCSCESMEIEIQNNWKSLELIMMKIDCITGKEAIELVKKKNSGIN